LDAVWVYVRGKTGQKVYLGKKKQVRGPGSEVENDWGLGKGPRKGSWKDRTQMETLHRNSPSHKRIKGDNRDRAYTWETVTFQDKPKQFQSLGNSGAKEIKSRGERPKCGDRSVHGAGDFEREKHEWSKGPDLTTKESNGSGECRLTEWGGEKSRKGKENKKAVHVPNLL